MLPYVSASPIRAQDPAGGEGYFFTRCRDRPDGYRDVHSQDNPKRALAFVDELEGKCEALGGAPGIGTSRPELGEGIRMLPHGRYLIFYREANRGLRIERVMHGSRDIGYGDFEASDPVGG